MIADVKIPKNQIESSKAPAALNVSNPTLTSPLAITETVRSRSNQKIVQKFTAYYIIWRRILCSDKFVIIHITVDGA